MNKCFKIVLSGFVLLTGCSVKAPKLGIEQERLSACPSTPNCVSSQAEDEAHYIDPLLAKGSSEKIKNDILRVLNDFQGAKIVATDDHYIRAEFTSALLRFVDDIEFYFPKTSLEETTVYVRSASRVGRSDFGVNKKRVESVRRELAKINEQFDY